MITGMAALLAPASVTDLASEAALTEAMHRLVDGIAAIGVTARISCEPLVSRFDQVPGTR